MRTFHRDLVYVFNAKLRDLQKAMQLFSYAASMVAQRMRIANIASKL